jgi:hypothetical protein
MKKTIAKKEVKKSPIEELIAQRKAAQALFQSKGFSGNAHNTGNKTFGAKQKKGSRGDR